MKKIILHVGLHKTGSSSIQQSLFNDRKKLEEQGVSYFCRGFKGIDVPLPEDWIDFNKFVFPKIKNPERFVSNIEALPQNTVIISIEALSWFISNESISGLAEVLSHFDVTVVMYLRRQDQQYVSYIQEGSKNINKPSRKYYGHSVDALPELSSTGYLDFYTRVLNYFEYFGKTNVIVRNFSKDRLVAGDVVKDFCSIIGLKEITTVRVNESLKFKSQKVGHLINKSGVLDNHLTNYLRRDIHELSDKRKMMPSREQAIFFYSNFIDSNKSLNRILVGNGDVDFFNTDFSMYPEIRTDLWTEESANEVIESLIVSFNKYKKHLYVEHLRDDAISLERSDLNKAYLLMKRAKDLRPNGYLINKKLEEYERLLSKK